MMQKINAIKDNDRGVSPVIGVILMVAITVILAAVIGTFVLGLGDSLGDSQPTAQIGVSLDGGNVELSHNGGDQIRTGDLTISVGGGTTYDLESNVTSPSVNADTQFSVGDTYTTNVTGATDDRVVIVHEPSDSIIVDRLL